MIEHTQAGALHLIFSDRGFRNCVNTLEDTSAATLLLLQDAVYAATHAQLELERCLVLKEDLALRGVADQVLATFEIVDRAAFVDLTAHHSPIVSWS